jgi:hypothetical protein
MTDFPFRVPLTRPLNKAGLEGRQTKNFLKGPHPNILYIYININRGLGLMDPDSYFKIKCLGVRD